MPLISPIIKMLQRDQPVIGSDQYFAVSVKYRIGKISLNKVKLQNVVITYFLTIRPKLYKTKLRISSLQFIILCDLTFVRTLFGSRVELETETQVEKIWIGHPPM